MRCLTVTCNTAVDTTYVLDRLTPGAIHRVARVLPAPGGKGNNVARVLRALGHDVVATGFAGGHTGRYISDALAALGIEPAFLPVPGDSRICLTLVEEATGRITEIREPGAEVPPGDDRRLIDHVVALARTVEVVAISGSLPPGLPPDFYADLVAAVRATGAFVALDSSGPALRAGLRGRPDLVKPNAEELAQLLGLADVAELTLDVAQRGLADLDLADDAAVLLSLGADGATLITKTDLVSAVPPAVAVVNTVGSGDALLAGFLDGRARAECPADALARAVAVGTAAALQDAIGVVAYDDVARLRPRVRILESPEVRAA